MKDQLETTLDQMETEVLETIENPYSAYLVQFPYTCSFTIPQDGNLTRVTIETKSEVLRYGRDNHDIELQMVLDQEYGSSTYAKHLIGWVSKRIADVDPLEVDVSYGDNPNIELMSDEQIDEFQQSCLNDE